MSHSHRLLIALVLSGCASTEFVGVHDYRPLVVKTSAAHKAVLEAAYRAARQAGAAHVDLIEEDLRVDAVFDEHDQKREHLRVQVSEWGDFSVDVRTEKVDAAGEWTAPERVRNDDLRAKERDIADTILAAVK